MTSVSCTVAICGSMAFIDDIEALARALVRDGYAVETPEREEVATDWVHAPRGELAVLKRGFIDRHLDKIRRADVVLLANYEKHGIAGYVGPNTLMEAAFGYALGLPVVLLFDPGDQPCSIELAGIARQVLGGDLGRLGAVRAAL